MQVMKLTTLLVFTAALTLQACGKKVAEDMSEPVVANSAACPVQSDLKLADIPVGTFKMGSDKAYAEERPVRQESVKAFRITTHEITNREFVAFTKATGYKTLAEKTPDPALHPDIPKKDLVAGSAVFVTPKKKTDYWWTFLAGANWSRPEGPGSNMKSRMDHPVVHIAYADAAAYAAWAGGRLPSEKEWEYAARGGLDGATYEWGEASPYEGSARANTWQGLFPYVDKGEDGHMGSAPVGQYEPNGYGLYDMSGNVWEWVADRNSARNAGLIKGGSFLCADNFCKRYRPSAKQPQELDFSANHIGFRVVFDSADQCRGGA